MSDAAKPASKTSAAVKTGEPAKKQGVPRHDVLIVSQNRTFGMVDQGTRAIINFLAAGGIMRPTDEAVAEEWIEVYGSVGSTAHEAFVKHGFDSDLAPFLECVVHTGKRYEPLPYGGDADEGMRFFIEFRGCLWETLAGRFKNRLVKALATRIDIYSRPHEGLPAHREVPEDEIPAEKKFARRDIVTERVGTAVEEF